jgi:hypothetical protein
MKYTYKTDNDGLVIERHIAQNGVPVAVHRFMYDE